MLRHIILTLILISCASQKRTQYESYNKKNGGGFQDKVLDEKLRIVNFGANANTKKDLAVNFAKFRAIEICTSEKKAVTHLLDVFDKTESKNVIRTSPSAYPSYYYGMSPFYNNYSGFGYQVAFARLNGHSWNETLIYPNIDVVFECAEKVFEPPVEFREIPADDMKHLIKDLKGGIQVEKFTPSTDKPKNLEIGDIVIRANGVRVQQIYQLLNLYHIDSDHILKIDFLRDGNLRKGIILKGEDATDKILKAQNDIIRSVCSYEELQKRALCK